MYRMSEKKKRYTDDEVIKAWPWFGGTPGRAARKIFALWVSTLVLLVVLMLYEIATLHICATVVVLVVLVVVAVFPNLALIGSRI
jgi:uncharacterized membrane protein YhaH (DUF805 family)